MTDIWAACGTRATPTVLDGTVLRLVESQEQVATNSLVRTLAEQALLEDLLERTKPPMPVAATQLHYLLATPFRYPPLRHGSRFGRRSQPSLFYGARAVTTLLAEGAYYRFVFWSGMETPPAGTLNTRHTVFGAMIRTQHALCLQCPPFDEYATTLRDRSSYADTQALGSAMREAGIEGFEFTSARDQAQGINVGLFSPAALASDRPTSITEWLCETRAELVRYYSREAPALREFPLDQFTVDGSLPSPAI
jgi:hypothetical protein